MRKGTKNHQAPPPDVTLSRDMRLLRAFEAGVIKADLKRRFGFTSTTQVDEVIARARAEREAQRKGKSDGTATARDGG